MSSPPPSRLAAGLVDRHDAQQHAAVAHQPLCRGDPAFGRLGLGGCLPALIGERRRGKEQRAGRCNQPAAPLIKDIGHCRSSWLCRISRRENGEGLRRLRRPATAPVGRPVPRRGPHLADGFPTLSCKDEHHDEAGDRRGQPAALRGASRGRTGGDAQGPAGCDRARRRADRAGCRHQPRNTCRPGWYHDRAAAARRGAADRR